MLQTKLCTEGEKYTIQDTAGTMDETGIQTISQKKDYYMKFPEFASYSMVIPTKRVSLFLEIIH